MKPKEFKIGSAMLALMEEHRIGRDDLMRVLGMMEDEGATKQLDLLEPAVVAAAKPEPQEPAKAKVPADGRIMQVVELARSNGGTIHYQEVMRALGISRGAATGALSQARKAGLMMLASDNGTTRLVDAGPSPEPGRAPRKVQRNPIGALEVMTWLEAQPTKRAHFREVADALGCVPERANNVLIELTSRGHVARVARGTYWVLPR